MNIFPFKKIFCYLSILILVVFISPAINSHPTHKTFSELAEELLPSVVNISTIQFKLVDEYELDDVPQFKFPPGSPFEDNFRDFYNEHRDGDTPKKRKTTQLGSGFIIGESGYVERQVYIVTNSHQIENAEKIEVIFQDETKLKAELVGKDLKLDIAVLKVITTKKVKALKWGDSSKSKVGDWVLTIGNPYGLGGTVTKGIISAKSRDIGTGPYDNFIQTDAPTNPGSSGGPMINMDGEVIGINTAMFSPSGVSVGIGFAIPSLMAIDVIEQLKKFGKTSRGWLGVRIQLVTEEIAEGFGLDSTEGALVASIENNSPSSRAGVKHGDIILKFNGKNIKSARNFPRIVATTKVGENVQLEIWRDKSIIHLNVLLGELESFENRKKDDSPIQIP